MVRKAVYRLPKWKIWKVLSSNRPRLHWEFLRAVYFVYFLFVPFIEKLLRVYEEKDLGVFISDKLT